MTADSTQTTPAAREADPFRWLEDIHGEAALEWVRARNAATAHMLFDDGYRRLESSLLEVLDADDRIPMASKHGGFYYNFWRDAAHPKGLWRRTTWDSYTSADPAWEVLLDVDALAAAEGTDWVYAGTRLLRPATGEPYRRALVRLSPDGGDAVVIREFDLEAADWVPGGLALPAAKTQISWDGPDAWYVGSDFGPGTLTASGYARTVRRLQRGEDPAAAPEAFGVAADHVMAVVSVDSTPGFERTTAHDVIDFFNSRTSVLAPGGWQPIEVPTDVRVGVHRQWLLLSPQTTWRSGALELPAGSLAVADLERFLAGDTALTPVFVPDAATSLQSYDFTRDYLLLNVLRDVSSGVLLADPSKGWAIKTLDVGSPLQSFSVSAVDDEDPETANDYWLSLTGFLSPATLARGTAAPDAVAPGHGLRIIKRAADHFDAAPFRVEQHFARSADGTAVPYFQVSPADLVHDGENPVLMNGYGGFETSLTPSYSPAVGRAWLDRRNAAGRRGVYVLANIRGGGEYGPRWHRAALRENRHRAYEDFAAIARDLVERGVTRPARLAATGRSNGGLLMGNMLTGYPELFGAISCGVPLLDMRRYTHLSAGHSWIAEYGDPEVAADWEFLRTFSPYHRIDEAVADGARFPPTLFWSATSDDRVGPVQARKMAAKMLELDIADVWFHESLDGGHAGAADNRQSAAMLATSYEFLWRNVADGPVFE